MKFQRSGGSTQADHFLARRAAEEMFQEGVRCSPHDFFSYATAHPGHNCGDLIEKSFEEHGAMYAASVAAAYWERLNELRREAGLECLPLSVLVTGIEWSVCTLHASDVEQIQQAVEAYGYRPDW